MAECLDADLHYPVPDVSYLGWFEWADEMGKTHNQTKCPGCGLYKIWTLRTPDHDEQRTDG